MKTFAAGLAAHYAQRSTTLAYFLEVTAKGGQVYRFTSADRDIVVTGQTYKSSTGLDVSNLDASAGLAVDGLQLTIFPDDDMLEADLLAGRLDFASYRIFEANYEDPAGGINLLRRGWTGNVETKRLGYTVELRSLRQALQQTVGAVTSKTCRARLGDEDCTVDLAPWTLTTTVSAVASRHAFTCGQSNPDDTYGDGSCTFNDGENATYAVKVKGSLSTGAVTLSRDAPFDINVGDSITLVAGCRKRLTEDCIGKFSNVLNFQGEPHMPGNDLLTADPEANV